MPIKSHRFGNLDSDSEEESYVPTQESREAPPPPIALDLHHPLVALLVDYMDMEENGGNG